ncbi:MAG: hypothetical protein CVU09_09630 [Bacteroidetes bacterium HGW-Bacteroidetes-4]|jgi:hypothetical protein|nr:MAG: hypothetical protein CVU09_09630 [Bacteroidetes bacterium HGW-Bacteroidetes-4]
MIISEIQMKAIRQLISKADKQQLSLHTQKSVRTIEAVLQSDRMNDEIEQAILLTAKQNLFALSNVIQDIEAKNTVKASLPEFRKYRSSATWNQGGEYSRYLDIYLQLTHLKLSGMEELWDVVWKDYKDLITKPYYCIYLFVRLLGVEDKEALSFFNKKLQNF